MTKTVKGKRKKSKRNKGRGISRRRHICDVEGLADINFRQIVKRAGRQRKTPIYLGGMRIR